MARRPITARHKELAWNIAGLDAERPWPEFERRLDLFGQFVGDWEVVEARYPKPESQEKHAVATSCIIGSDCTQDVQLQIG